MDSSSFIPLGNRARWAIVLLAATIVVDVIAIGSDFRLLTSRQLERADHLGAATPA